MVRVIDMIKLLVLFSTVCGASRVGDDESMAEYNRKNATLAYRMVLGGMGTLFRDELNIVGEVKRMAEEARPGKEKYTVAFFGSASFDKNPKDWKNAWTMDRAQTWEFKHISLANANAYEVSTLNEKEDYSKTIQEADVILCAGGNAPFLWAQIKRWKLALDIRRAAENGAVMAGGSAGGLIYTEVGFTVFGEGTYMNYVAAEAKKEAAVNAKKSGPSSKTLDASETQEGAIAELKQKMKDDGKEDGEGNVYHFAKFLGLFPIPVSPHCDGPVTYKGDNADGLKPNIKFRRYSAFAQKILAKNAAGICIDNMAVVAFDGPNNRYRVLQAEQNGMPDQSFRPLNGMNQDPRAIGPRERPAGALLVGMTGGACAQNGAELGEAEAGGTTCDLKAEGKLNEILDEGLVKAEAAYRLDEESQAINVIQDEVTENDVHTKAIEHAKRLASWKTRAMREDKEIAAQPMTGGLDDVD